MVYLNLHYSSIKALDSDSNGIVTKKEYGTFSVKNFTNFDADKSGGLNLMEMKKLINAPVSERQKRKGFRFVDKNGDGLLSEAELRKEYEGKLVSMAYYVFIQSAECGNSLNSRFGKNVLLKFHGSKIATGTFTIQNLELQLTSDSALSSLQRISPIIKRVN